MCDICKMVRCHPQCPNYAPKKSVHYCSICGNEIYDGEEYIENVDGEFRHFECFYSMRELLEWLGYEIKMMNDEE